MVLVQDMDRALRFYRDLLGLTLEQEAEDFAVFREGIGLMLSPEPLPAESFNLNAVMVTLQVDSVQAAFNDLTGKGVPFFVPPTDVGGAMIASFRDTEGNIIQIM